MVYSDVIKNKWHLILSKKDKYTKRDVDKVWIESFMNKEINNGITFTEQECVFIALCTAVFHDSNYSMYIGNYHSKKSQLKRYSL
jgi:hypothetical protein